MRPDIPEVFIPDDIIADGLILVGYQLFPAAYIALHPRMTVLSGNNAVGKTTILDAVQTILICHQQYINLNVATGQFDRSLSGQLSGRVGWAVLSIAGHAEIKAIGVRLHARATAEGLDLTPFTMTSMEPFPDLFLNKEKSQIVPDFQNLKKNVLKQDIQAQVNDFASVDEYHRLLFSQGLLPVTMDRQGKKKFATLWSQVTRPKLDRLGLFLKEMLCPDPSQGVKFSDVEKLMRDRRSISSQIKSIEIFRKTRLELEEQRKTLDSCRYKYLSTELGMLQARARLFHSKIEREKKREQETVEALKQIESRLENSWTEKKDINQERDKYLSRQTELSRQKRHFEEYQNLIREEKQLGLEMSKITDGLSAAEKFRQDTASQVLEIKEQHGTEQAAFMALQEKLKFLLADKEKYEAFVRKLEQSLEKTGRPIKTWQELNEAWLASEKEKNRLDSLPELKVRLEEIRRRVELREQAVELAEWFKRSYPETTPFFSGNRQDFISLIRQWEDIDFESGITKKGAELDKLLTLIDGLEKGRPGISDTVARHVDAGRLALVADKYEHLDLERASQVQAGLGPYARGVVVQNLEEVAQLDLGDEEFMLLSRDVDPDKLRLVQTSKGTVSGMGGLYWFTPDEPLWLGAQARARELSKLNARREILEEELESLNNERRQNAQRISKARELAGFWAGLEDKSCVDELTALDEEIKSLESQGWRIRDTYQYLNSLVRKRDLFDLHTAPKIYARAHKQAQEAQKSLEKLKGKMARLEKEQVRADSDLKRLQEQQKSKDRRLTEIQVTVQNLIREEPVEVLEGKIDFSQADALAGRIKAFDEQLRRIEESRDRSHQEKGRKNELLRLIQKELEGFEKELRVCQSTEEKRLTEWQDFYPDINPEYRQGNFTRDDSTLLKSQWLQAEKFLEKIINDVSAEHSLHLPHDVSSETKVDLILNNIIPQAVDLDRVEEQFQRLKAELKEIEARIRSYVQDIKRRVDQDISNLKRRLDKVNTILADIRFGRISQVRVELQYLPSYAGLKSLQGDRLTLLDFDSKTTLEEFVQELIRNIFRHGQTRISEDQIADYRTYIEMTWSITDLEGNVRQKGFSGGETLGINLAICLGLLFHWGGEAGHARRGLLIMALDEAERLDEQAVNTVRELLDRVECQLLVALPRTMRVPKTLCHMLTPLAQGVTHISVYHKG
ncbi:SbcC/MukB-like Walker B domain-containing protein [Desulfonatronovibrio magnus]|uniref:SbcC/MukB-like Walker B domain-containing protein n=1 Tax=Desulfonatronovibrio magnus TaxID=698827 RepID=UPI0005EBD3E6|nr:SbcC/MukB-like Walker B domain-containing protein [Desulfonatronovibrio magnus]